MNILTAENLTKAYTDKPLFKNVSFIIDETDKIGIIGVNGTGKSTLLKMLAGLEVPDSGEIKLIGNLKVSYLPQSPVFDAGKSVINQVFNSDDPLLTIIKEYEELTSNTENIDTDRLSSLMDAAKKNRFEIKDLRLFKMKKSSDFCELMVCKAKKNSAEGMKIECRQM